MKYIILFSLVSMSASFASGYKKRTYQEKPAQERSDQDNNEESRDRDYEKSGSGSIDDSQHDNAERASGSKGSW